MDQKAFLQFLGTIEKLKCNTRHSWTSSGRRESVAEHTFRLCIMAMLCADEYPTLDIDKVIKMCLIHDFGEAITGDIPAFLKTEEHERVEENAINDLLSTLPKQTGASLSALFAEMKAQRTEEARLYKSLDKIETLISHNEADLSTWIPCEYHDNLVYGDECCTWSPWIKELRELVRADSIDKIKEVEE